MEAPARRSPGHRRPWQDLPSELLGLVLQRVQSHADRVRLRAVCRPWRAGARLQLPPPPALLPWLALRDGTFLSLPDGEVHRRVLLPGDDVAHRVSTGSMLSLVHSDDGCSLINPLLPRETTAPRRIDLNCLRTRPAVLVDTGNIRKMVVMSDHAVAVRTGPGMYIHDVTVSIRRPGSTAAVERRWSPPRDTHSSVCDIALFQNKLYVLTAASFGAYPLRLYAMDVAGGNGDDHVSVQCILTAPRDDAAAGECYVADIHHYLVASGERLLMVKQKRDLRPRGYLLSRPAARAITSTWFEVFEVADRGSDQGCWRKVSTLAGRALFLSEGCSRSLLAGAGSGGDQCAGAREECIYFLSELHDYYSSRRTELNSGVYNMKDGIVSPLPFETVVARARHGPFTATWFFPADT